jgi:hypothetical protein
VSVIQLLHDLEIQGGIGRLFEGKIIVRFGGEIPRRSASVEICGSAGVAKQGSERRSAAAPNGEGPVSR